MGTCLEEDGCRGKNWYRILTCLEEEFLRKNGYGMEACVKQEGCLGRDGYGVHTCLKMCVGRNAYLHFSFWQVKGEVELE